MPAIETLERFIAVVESNAHDVAAEEFYTGNSMQDALSWRRSRGSGSLIHCVDFEMVGGAR